MLFAELESSGVSSAEVSPSSGLSSGTDLRDAYRGTLVSPEEMRWISFVCYLNTDETREIVRECIESLGPCPISRAMDECFPQDIVAKP